MLAASPTWDATGAYEVAFNYLGTDYSHDLMLTQDSLGGLTGNGGSPVGANVSTWVITSGSVMGNVVDFSANYTATADAVTPQTVLHVVGTVASNGTLSGTWSDNYAGGTREGTWVSTSGVALQLGVLAAEDFGVVHYDSGLGILNGYTAGFGLTDATFEGAQSVVVKLYGGTTLLQTNTATAQLGVDVIGNQTSSPFDVSGTFDYATDGYWVNVKESEYGQSVPATKVVATVMLSNGKVITAENTVLVGDPATTYPDVVVPPAVTAPTEKSECKNEGWKTFTDPTFKNQGQCVKFVEHLTHGDHDKDADKDEHASHRHDKKDERRDGEKTHRFEKENGHAEHTSKHHND